MYNKQKEVYMDFMDFDEHVQELLMDHVKKNVNYLGLGLTGEAGEVAEKLKKLLRDGSINKNEVLKELGDVLFYTTALANAFGFGLEEVAQANINKLQDRKNRNVLSGKGDNR